MKKNFREKRTRVSSFIILIAMCLTILPTTVLAVESVQVSEWSQMEESLSNVDAGGVIEITNDLKVSSTVTFPQKQVRITSAEVYEITRENEDQGGEFFHVPDGATVMMDAGAGHLTLDSGNKGATGLISNSGTLTLKNITLSNTKSGPTVTRGAVINNGTLTIGEGTQFISNKEEVGAVANSGSLIIEGGTISDSSPIFNDIGATITLNGGLTSGTLEITDAYFAGNGPYQISSALNSNVKIYPNSSLKDGDIVFEPASGYDITSEDLGKVSVEGNYTLALENGNIIVKGTEKPAGYTFGKDEITYKRDQKPLENTIDSPSANIMAIVLDATELSGEGHCSVSGIDENNSKVTFDSKWMDSLENGTYQITAYFGDNAQPATMNLVVTDSDGENEGPKNTESTGTKATKPNDGGHKGAATSPSTGDSKTLPIFFAIALCSTVIAVVALWRKRAR